MSDRKSEKIHYVISPSAGYTFCGRYVTMTLQVSRKASEVTCATCLREINDPARPADGSTVLSEG